MDTTTIAQQFQPALAGEMDTPKKILNAINKEDQLGSAVRAGLRVLFTTEECVSSVRTEKGIKMSKIAKAVLDDAKLKQARELTDRWCVARGMKEITKQNFNIHVKRHFDEVKDAGKEKKKKASGNADA